MTNYTIKSKILNRDVVFSIPGESYIYVDLDGDVPGSLGWQICEGGRLLGDTIMYSGEDEAEFAKVCRNWLRSYLRNRK